MRTTDTERDPSIEGNKNIYGLVGSHDINESESSMEAGELLFIENKSQGRVFTDGIP